MQHRRHRPLDEALVVVDAQAVVEIAGVEALDSRREHTIFFFVSAARAASPATRRPAARAAATGANGAMLAYARKVW